MSSTNAAASIAVESLGSFDATLYAGQEQTTNARQSPDRYKILRVAGKSKHIMRGKRPAFYWAQRCDMDGPVCGPALLQMDYKSV
jgi:hypothetical protein